MVESAGDRTEAVRQGASLAAVAFDVNETLIDLSSLDTLFEGFGLGAHARRWWFAAVLRDGFALAAAGGTGGFPDLALSALEEVFAEAGRAVPAAAGRAVLDAFGDLPAYGDVEPALRRLKEAGIAAFALTNGNGTVAERLLGRCGALPLLSGVLSVDAVGHWKPRPEPYEYAAAFAGVAVSRLAMVAVHPWDLHGAAVAGLVTGWVNRTGRTFPPLFRPPTLAAVDLDALATRLVSLSAG